MGVRDPEVWQLNNGRRQIPLYLSDLDDLLNEIKLRVLKAYDGQNLAERNLMSFLPADPPVYSGDDDVRTNLDDPEGEASRVEE